MLTSNRMIEVNPSLDASMHSALPNTFTIVFLRMVKAYASPR